MSNQPMQHMTGWPVQTDQELIDRFQQGDESTFDELVRRHEQRIRALCGCYLSDPQDVQDAAQETFIRAFRGLPSFRPEARFSTWLFRIAIHTSLNQVRSRRRRGWMQAFSRLPGMEDQIVTSRMSAPTPLEEVERAEQQRLIRAALDSLPEEQRTAVILHRFHGLKYQEIADATGSSLAAVEARIHRAKGRLAVLLAEYMKE